ncbi:MAG: hypothetical protein K2L07_02745 [Lachnospiraceae bacterium]|nr:hypothetical protein [Lachnospiraceae bacterium]
MRKRICNILLGMLCLVLGILLVLPAQTAKANEETENLSAPLTILDFKISSKTAKPGDNISYSFILAETGLKEFSEKYGQKFGIYDKDPQIFDITIYWRSPRKPGTENRSWYEGIIQQEVVHTFDWQKVGAEKKLKVSGTIPIMKGMQSGTWVIDQIECYISEDSSLLLINKDKYLQSEHGGSILMDFSMADFTVTGTGRADYKAPTIDIKSLKRTKRYVKKNQSSIFYVKVKDESKIKEVGCSWELYEKGNYGKEGDWDRDYKMTYNKKKKRYQCSVKLNKKEYRKAMLRCIYVKDIYGNEAYYKAVFDDLPSAKNKKYYNAFKKMMVIAR